jgi:hypothetical protein
MSKPYHSDLSLSPKESIMRRPTILLLAAAALALAGLGSAWGGWAGVVREGDRILIVDRTGERWDVTQAASLGFKPRGFQYGIGRDAIRPLDDSSLADTAPSLDDDTRVLGVANGPDAHAYVVRRLTRHEIANTALNDTPIAAAY